MKKRLIVCGFAAAFMAVLLTGCVIERHWRE